MVNPTYITRQRTLGKSYISMLLYLGERLTVSVEDHTL